MSDLTFEIGAYDPDTRSVPVTFTLGDVVHKRSVNACLDDKSGYDEEATAARVAEVGNGVAVKISLGVIKNEPEPEAPAEPVDETPPAA